MLERLLPMQRDDFTQLFRIMQGQPVCIRLFDPPLHEFLPADQGGQRELAEALDLPLSDVTRRIEAMSEYNPMLGHARRASGHDGAGNLRNAGPRDFRSHDRSPRRCGRSCRNYDPAGQRKREVELVKSQLTRWRRCAHEKGTSLTTVLGVMVETPRAALRAGDIARIAAFLSFGTNDLTQMTYGLSRDDAGRFMSDYVHSRSIDEDPFHTLDVEGWESCCNLGPSAARNRSRTSHCRFVASTAATPNRLRSAGRRDSTMFPVHRFVCRLRGLPQRNWRFRQDRVEWTASWPKMLCFVEAHRGLAQVRCRCVETS